VQRARHCPYADGMPFIRCWPPNSRTPRRCSTPRGPSSNDCDSRGASGGWGSASRAKPKGGVSGDEPFGQRNTTIPASSHSIVRRYMCAALFRPTSISGRHSFGSVRWVSKKWKQRECGAFPLSLGARPALRFPRSPPVCGEHSFRKMAK
jgi:hypothetical protein